jgi:hypothetical protein
MEGHFYTATGRALLCTGDHDHDYRKPEPEAAPLASAAAALKRLDQYATQASRR